MVAGTGVFAGYGAMALDRVLIFPDFLRTFGSVQKCNLKIVLAISIYTKYFIANIIIEPHPVFCQSCSNCILTTFAKESCHKYLVIAGI